MLYKSLLKNPILMIGILFMSIFLMTHGKKFMQEYKTNLTPTSCRALMVKLERRLPAHWKAHCEENNLAVEYSLEIPKKIQKQNEIRQFAYRELANSLSFIAKNSPEDNMQKTDVVRVRMKLEKLTINAVTEGRFLSKLYSLTDPKLITKHIQATVQVQEVPN
ncbi:MAG: hypothetical protein ACPGJV_03100 [Bacteriovoracaceae bacterium]